MRKIIVVIIFLIIIFVVNLSFYFLSNDYKFFIKKLKDNDKIIYLEDKVINDELEIIKTSKKNDNFFELKEKTKEVNLKQEIVLGKNYKKVINLFGIYKLIKLELNSYLFDLTDEYPDNYFEYYSKDLTLYIFPTKTYSELFDIFSVLEDELPFFLNEVNNFGDKSFYINLNDDIEDRFIRIIISNKGVVFGLKIKKTEYDLVKEKLNSLKIENNISSIEETNLEIK